MVRLICSVRMGYRFRLLNAGSRSCLRFMSWKFRRKSQPQHASNEPGNPEWFFRWKILQMILETFCEKTPVLSLISQTFHPMWITFSVRNLRSYLSNDGLTNHLSTSGPTVSHGKRNGAQHQSKSKAAEFVFSESCLRLWDFHNMNLDMPQLTFELGNRNRSRTYRLGGDNTLGLHDEDQSDRCTPPSVPDMSM